MWIRPLLAIVMVALLPAPRARAEEPAAAPAWAHYQVLVERNMFSRERRSPAAPTTDGGERPVETEARPANPDGYLVLVGVLAVGPEVRAVLEDGLTGRVRMVAADTTLARGRIAAIALTGIDYELEGRTTHVRIGNNLTGDGARRPGARPGARSAARSGAGTEGGTEPAHATDAPARPAGAGAGAGSVLERLRQRRREELGR